MIIDSWLIWLIAAAGCLAIEVLTQSMWALCLAAGSLLAMVAALLGLDAIYQVAALAIGSFAAYLLLIPIFKRMRARFN